MAVPFVFGIGMFQWPSGLSFGVDLMDSEEDEPERTSPCEARGTWISGFHDLPWEQEVFDLCIKLVPW